MRGSELRTILDMTTGKVTADTIQVTVETGTKLTITTTELAGGTFTLVAEDTTASVNITDDSKDGDVNFNGTQGNDTLTGGKGSNTIDGKAGNDIINAGKGDDIITGGKGADTINVGEGTDTVKIIKTDIGDNRDAAGSDADFAKTGDIIKGMTDGNGTGTDTIDLDAVTAGNFDCNFWYVVDYTVLYDLVLLRCIFAYW